MDSITGSARPSIPHFFLSTKMCEIESLAAKGGSERQGGQRLDNLRHNSCIRTGLNNHAATCLLACSFVNPNKVGLQKCMGR